MFTVKRISIESKDRIGLFSSGYDAELPIKMKSVAGARWSPEFRCWHLPYSPEAWSAFKTVFDGYSIKNIETEPVSDNKRQENEVKPAVSKQAIILSAHPSEPQYLSLNLPSELIESQLSVVKNIHGRRWDPRLRVWMIPFTRMTLRFIDRYFDATIVRRKFEIPDDLPEKLSESEQNTFHKTAKEAPKARYEAAVVALEQVLLLKRYSWRTIKAYKNCLRSFIRFYDDIRPREITRRQINDFLTHLVKDRHVSASHQSQMMSAIKMFYAEAAGQPEKVENMYQPKKPQQLPKVLTEAEVAALLKAVDNIKHRSLLMLIYSGGLRLGEAIHLRINDLQPANNRIFIRNGKGGKDRCTLLSEKAWEHLQKYLDLYRPVEWVFEGPLGGQYSERSVQEVFTKAKKKALINPSATVHTLRHSFATHLLEKGVDLRYIQELLGHASSKTTEIYAHITKKGWEKIKSPLDSLSI